MVVEIVCIGGANLDRKATCARIRPGTSNPVRFRESPGGVARNVSENLARLGSAVALISFVGEDRDGDFLLSHCQAAGVDVSRCQRLSGNPTGAYWAVMDTQGELQLALSDMAIYDEIRWEMLVPHASLMASARLVFGDTNLPTVCLEQLAQAAARGEIRLIVDCVSVEKSKKLPGDLSGLTLLLGNQDEAREVLGWPVDSIADPALVRQAIQKRGLNRAVITLGPDGVFFCEEGRHGLIPALPVERVSDVTGAGDSFSAGLLSGLCRGLPLPEAVGLAQRLAALTLQSEFTVSPQVGPHCLIPEGTKP